MRFKQWLINESNGQLLLAKATGKEGLDSIKKDGFKLGDRHQAVIKYYDKYGDITTEQLYGPGLYFGIVPNQEFARKNCKQYADEWGEHIVIATLKSGSKGLITNILKDNPIWNYSPAYNPSAEYTPTTYEQLKALGVSHLFPDYGPNNIHNDNSWGYKLYKKIDFWAHMHNFLNHIVVYNPSVLQFVSEFECEHKRVLHSVNNQQNTNQQNNPNQAPPGKIWNKLLNRWIDKPNISSSALIQSDLNLDLDGIPAEHTL